VKAAALTTSCGLSVRQLAHSAPSARSASFTLSVVGAGTTTSGNSSKFQSDRFFAVGKSMPKKKQVSSAEKRRRQRQSESARGIIYVNDGAGGIAKMVPAKKLHGHRIIALN
jgi:hypothetical protein